MRTEIKLSLLIPIFSIGLFSIANCQSKTNQSKVKMPTLPKDGGSVGSSPSSEISLPTIIFKNNSGGSMITKDQIIVLDKIAASIKENPEGKIKVSGHGSDTKIAQQQ